MSKVLVPLVLITVLFTPRPAYSDWEEGLAAFNAGRYEEAADEFRKMSNQNPERWEGHYMLGLSLEQLSRPEEALQSLERAYELNSEELGVMLALGRAYFGLQRFGEVDELLGSVDADTLPEAQQKVFYQLRGMARSQMSSDTESLEPMLEAMESAIALHPDNTENKRDYARALIRKGQISQSENAQTNAYSEAVRVAAELVEVERSYDNYMLRMYAELSAGFYPEAIATGRAAVASKDSDWLAHYYLGLAYSLAGNDLEAATQLETARSVARDRRESALTAQAEELLEDLQGAGRLQATTQAMATALSEPSKIKDILLRDLMSAGDTILGCPRGTTPCVRYGRPACC